MNPMLNPLQQDDKSQCVQITFFCILCLLFRFFVCFFFLMDCLKYGLLSAQEFFFPLGTNKDTLTLRIVFFLVLSYIYLF